MQDSTNKLASFLFGIVEYDGDFDDEKLEITVYNVHFNDLDELIKVVKHYDYNNIVPNYIFNNYYNVKIFLNN